MLYTLEVYVLNFDDNDYYVKKHDNQNLATLLKFIQLGQHFSAVGIKLHIFGHYTFVGNQMPNLAIFSNYIYDVGYS